MAKVGAETWQECGFRCCRPGTLSRAINEIGYILAFIDLSVGHRKSSLEMPAFKPKIIA
jgi:hypothetical protein